MTLINCGINGFGRIGRLVMRSILTHPEVEVTAINTPFATEEQMAYYLQHDSVHGKLSVPVTYGDGYITIDGKKITVHKMMEPNKIAWKSTGVEYVIDCTGVFLTVDSALKHIEGGAKKVIVSAPAKDDMPVIVMGVNHQIYKPDMNVISNASCTTNCAAPLTKVLHDNYGIVNGFISTVHSVTANQNVVDNEAKGGKDFRMGRSGMTNIIPSTTGAAKTVTKVIPDLKGKLTGMAFRVPTTDVSVIDFTVNLEKPASMDEIKKKIIEASLSSMQGILSFTEEPLVSTDYIGNPYSCIVDFDQCYSLSPTFHKFVAWYDNEWGYSKRIVDLLLYIARK